MTTNVVSHFVNFNDHHVNFANGVNNHSGKYGKNADIISHNIANIDARKHVHPHIYITIRYNPPTYISFNIDAKRSINV